MFISVPKGRTVGSSGETNAKICLIGEAPAREEMLQGRPFVGEAGVILDQCLHNAGLLRGQCYITNFADFQIKKGDIVKYFSTAGCLKGKGLTCQQRLLEEVDGTECNIYVTLGAPAICALTGL